MACVASIFAQGLCKIKFAESKKEERRRGREVIRAITRLEKLATQDRYNKSVSLV